MSRILHWIRTGEHIVTDYIECRAVGSETSTGSIEGGSASKAISTPSDDVVETFTASTSGSLTEESPASEPKPIDLLVGCSGDIFIPSTEQISATFLQCQNLWSTYVTSADLFPPGCMPAAGLEGFDLMHCIPPLPQNLHKKHFIAGRALWDVPSPEFHAHNTSPHTDKDHWNPERVHGATKNFPLSIQEPTRCGISSRSDFSYWESGEFPAEKHPPNGLFILTLMWSYILSARLLEMQRRTLQYSRAALSPILIEDVRPQGGEVVIDTAGASRALVRWICALLVQGQGWLVRGPLPPWAAYYDGDCQFIVATTRQSRESGTGDPPSSAEATELLIEFCQLYPFGSQPTAAFLYSSRSAVSQLAGLPSSASDAESH